MKNKLTVQKKVITILAFGPLLIFWHFSSRKS